MQLHNLKKSVNKKNKKRIGRGGKRGVFSGKGVKGQKSRAGHKIPSKTKWLIKRFPKLRGIKFKSRKPDVKVINVGDLKKICKNEKITKKDLVRTGVIKNERQLVKILSDGKLEKKYIIEGIPVSKQAVKKIEKAGGKVLPEEDK